jgi:hypothetical protein
MRALRIISGGIGTIVSPIVYVPAALDWILFEGQPPQGVLIGVGVVWCLLVLAGPFALFMAAMLSEGQYTRANRRFLLACLIFGALPVLVFFGKFDYTHEYLFGGAALLTTACLAIVIWCILHMKEAA